MEVVSSRFEELKEAKIIGEFNKLKHTGSYAEYVDKFEELHACMMMLNNGVYTEDYFIASFISGLSEESQAFINMFEPTTLHQTIELGRKQLCTMEAIAKKVKAPTKPSFGASVNNEDFEFNTIPPPKPQYPSSSKPPLKLLSSSEMVARREKGLCYNCDETFTFGHRCKNRVTYMIMTEDEELSYMQDHKALEQEVEQPNLPMEEVRDVTQCYN
ncbi:hypothetical protein DH2020_025894 [Rehmannia glutinosa]|uniref:Retrotransposon gag domain-containing protein n=1 Tax=Rehmannia glutinosa TaxID=99300 RepID=A0ABR0VYE2_REHGL